MVQVFRQAARPAAFASKFSAPRFSPIASRYLSSEVRQQIDQVVGSKPVVLFMKGTPEMPQCGFSRASIQILSLQGVDPDKFAALNVLEDEGLRQGKHSQSRIWYYPLHELTDCLSRYQRIFGMANDTTTLRRQGIRRWMRYPGCDAPKRGAS
ncbi:monothiol glutaredoxin grx5 [Clarireedia jacksonii]